LPARFDAHPERNRPGAEARAVHGPQTEIDRVQQAEARKRRAEGATLAELARSSERPVVPLKPGNAGGGKGPQFKTNATSGEGPGDWAT
jgi:hypothetical protein